MAKFTTALLSVTPALLSVAFRNCTTQRHPCMVVVDLSHCAATAVKQAKWTTLTDRFCPFQRIANRRQAWKAICADKHHLYEDVRLDNIDLTRLVDETPQEIASDIEGIRATPALCA